MGDIVKELRLSALHKIKLKALLKKLPSNGVIRYETVVKKIESEEKKEYEFDDDDKFKKSKHSMAQILFLKEENLRLSKISNENGMKQQIMELWDSMFDKDVKLQTMQKKNEC